MKLKSIFSIGALLLTGLIGMSLIDSVSSNNETASEALEQGFLSPPNSAKPRVWWHWMNGNISKDGITKDLQWMKRVGIGGMQNFDAARESPQFVETRSIYMTPSWKDAFSHAARLADELDLELTIHSSPGWSVTGGPWVRPNEAMKKYVWSEITIEGGKPFTGRVPKPPTTTGSFQNLVTTGRAGIPTPYFEHYADQAVIAYRLPDSYKSMSELNPVITSSGGNFTLAQLTDGDVALTSPLPIPEVGQTAWIQFEFQSPVTIQALSIVATSTQAERILEAGNDGTTFNKVIDIPAGGGRGGGQRTLSFSPTTAKYFRVSFNRLPATTPGGGGGGMGGAQQAAANYTVAELVLYPDARVHRFEDKAGFSSATDLYTAFTMPVSAADVVKKSDVIDITDKLNADGTLNWTPPAGKWKIMRLGYSLTGQTNGPAAAEATGLEIDKLSAEHVTSYINRYFDMYYDATQGFMGQRGLQYLLTDSYEAGYANWTELMMSEFEKSRGYSMLTWLPVLSGQIIESAEASDKFLWDFRKTLSDMIVRTHYATISSLLKARGMRGLYTESHAQSRAFIADGMQVVGNADIPMAEFWTPQWAQGEKMNDIATRFRVDIKDASSASHIYGQNLVAAESFTASVATGAWAWHPGNLKPHADWALYCGLNRFVIHTSPHQPSDTHIPGVGLGSYGQWFTRHETYAEQAVAWMTYLGRSCFMLQQGRYVADVAYYYGEDINTVALFRNVGLPLEVPREYNFDFVNSDILVNLLRVDNGKLVTPSGMSYSVLYLDDNSKYMTLQVLRKVKELVENGAIVCGAKPLQSPSLVDNPDEFNTIVRQLWARNGANRTGKGIVYVGNSLQNVLNAQRVAPDFSYRKPRTDSEMFFVHRKMDDIEIYWVANHNDRVEDIEATFRVSGMEPEIWNAATGTMEKVSYTISGSTTRIPLHLEPYDAVFVVFRNKTANRSFTLPRTTTTQLSTVTGEWNVAFQAGRGAPATAVFPSLTQWNENSNSGIKYFSGVATYTKSIQAPAAWFTPGAQLWLDLGQVEVIAEVTVNGKPVGYAWTKPYRVNVTDALKEGDNQVEIKVANLWINRLVGDQQPGATKITWINFEPYQANTPLKPSGLLGPVTVSKTTR